MNKRVDQVRAAMAAQGMDAFLVTEAKNRRYLSGFTGSSGALLITADAQYVVTDFRYVEQVAQQAPAWTLHKQANNLIEAVAELLGTVAPPRLGFEADALTVADFARYGELGPDGIEWRPSEGLVRRLRATKEEAELAAMRRAQAITDAAAATLPTLIEPGRSEREVAWALERTMRELGADGPAFDVIVASGPNAALPHHRPSERIIQADEVVLVDFGAQRDGYHSDMTRTYFTGEPSAQFRHLFQIVLGALHEAEAQIRAGAGAKAMDDVARRWITEHDYGEHFGHGLGHGVGLDIHEMPSLSWRVSEEERLRAGQVVTVEPGIYLPGWGGIRIEDMAVVTEEGIEILTQTAKTVDGWREGRAAR